MAQQILNLWLLSRQQVLSNHGHFRTKPSVGLRDFTPDGTASNNEQVSRQAVIFKDLLIRGIGNIRKPGDCRNAWLGSAIDQYLLRANPLGSNLKRMWIEKPCSAHQDIHALPPQGLRHGGFIDLLDGGAKIGSHLGHVRCRCADADSIAGSGSRMVSHARHFDE